MDERISHDPAGVDPPGAAWRGPGASRASRSRASPARPGGPAPARRAPAGAAAGRVGSGSPRSGCSPRSRFVVDASAATEFRPPNRIAALRRRRRPRAPDVPTPCRRVSSSHRDGASAGSVGRAPTLRPWPRQRSSHARAVRPPAPPRAARPSRARPSARRRPAPGRRRRACELAGVRPRRRAGARARARRQPRARADPRPPRPVRSRARRGVPRRRARRTTPARSPASTRRSAVIQRHVAAGSRITVHGDYDVDGVCATAIMVRALRSLGADVDWFLPSRLDDGYGLVGRDRRAAGATRGTRLLITVDCGITAVEEVGRRPRGRDRRGGHRPPPPRAPTAPPRRADRPPGGVRLSVPGPVRHRRRVQARRRRSARRRSTRTSSSSRSPPSPTSCPLRGRESPPRARGPARAGQHRQARPAGADGGVARRPERR